MSELNRGEDAERPTEISKEGWKEILKRVKAESKRDNVALLAGGVAFYGVLALFPAMVAMVSLYALVAEPETLQRQVEDLLGAAPDEVRQLIVQQLTSLSESSEGGLTLGLIGGIVLALWSASSGMKHLMSAVNVAYDEEETRGFVRLRGVALLLTLGTILFIVASIGLIAALPAWLDTISIGDAARAVLNLLRWPLMLIAFMVGLAIVYRYAPDRQEPHWAWVSWGAVVAGLVFIAASIGFAFYTRYFGNYNETYGTFGAIVVLMLWLLVTAAVVIFGAELNAEIERQARRDTTVGEERPMGERDAVVADTAPEDPAERVRPDRGAPSPVPGEPRNT